MERGKKILMKTFWNSQGWFYTDPSPEEYEIALSEGYFLPVRENLSHEEAMTALGNLLEQISPQEIAEAFLYSLSTRELAYRSALGTFWFARAIPAHSHDTNGICPCCGWSNFKTLVDLTRYPAYTDDNRMNFERHNWGGVRFTNLNYILLDLSKFQALPKHKPTDRDYDILREILASIDELPPTKKAGAFRDLLSKKKLLPANKAEIGSMLDILGICGVLTGEAHPCPVEDFHGTHGLPPREHTNDFKYPVSYWHASDGVNERRFRDVFGFDYQEL